MRITASPFSLRLGHRTALVLLTPFTTVLPLRYLWRARKARQIPVQISTLFAPSKSNNFSYLQYFIFSCPMYPLSAIHAISILFIRGHSEIDILAWRAKVPRLVDKLLEYLSIRAFDPALLSHLESTVLKPYIGQ